MIVFDAEVHTLRADGIPWASWRLDAIARPTSLEGGFTRLMTSKGFVICFDGHWCLPS
jgi:hypothetical protein